MDQPEYERMYDREASHWWFVHRRMLAAALFDQYVKALRTPCILDVGCGTGGNLGFLASWGKVTGIDISPVALNLARRREALGLAHASGMALPFPGETFGLVTAFDVLYHRWIADDTVVISDCYRVLRPLGWLLLTDSAMPGLWSAHDEVYYARQRYLLSDMVQKLTRVGFQVKVCSYNNAPLLPVLILVRQTIRLLSLSTDFDFRPLPAWLNRLLIAIHSLEGKWLRRGGTLPLGSSLICLAQKPLT